MTTETGVGVRQSHAKECWLPPEAGRGKETDYPLAYLEVVHTC